ncbi:MAG: DUF4277 domain-containing protein [Pleurocapsa sp.]
MKPSTAEIKVKDLNHYGIIAGIIDEIGLVEKINELVGTHERQKITPGLAVKAMIMGLCLLVYNLGQRSLRLRSKLI